MNAFKPAFRPAIRPAITSVFGVQVPVIAPPSLVSQPQSKTVDEYALATFSCEVTGGVAPYSYQWKKNAANVGTNSAALSFTAAATDKNASITVTVTDSVGALITSSAAILGVTSYVYRLDGITQYIQLSSNVNVLANDLIELNFKAPVAAYNNAYFIAGTDSPTEPYYLLFAIDSTGRFDRRPVASTVVVDGIETTLLPLDGAYHNVKSLVSASSWFRWLGVRYSLDQRFAAFPLFKLSVKRSGVEIINIPLNNKGQGANQLATVGSVNATIINYNAAGWVAI